LSCSAVTDRETATVIQEDEQWPRPGYAWLLARDCGEAGCWPLEARIITSAETVTWTSFA
jgi:hypothetical protein